MSTYGFLVPMYRRKPVEELSVYPSEMSAPPELAQEEPESAAVAATALPTLASMPPVALRVAREAWDRLKGPADPPAEVLNEETQVRLALFACDIRNRTIESLAAAVEKYYAKVNASAAEALRSLKE